MFGEIPAYGFFIRHVRGLEMNAVAVSYLKDDARPPFMISDAAQVDLRNIKAQHGAGIGTFSLQNVTDFSLQQSFPLQDVRLARVARRQL